MGEVKLKLESNFSLFQSIWNNQVHCTKTLDTGFINSFVKVTGCLCVSVKTKNLTNRWTDMVTLYKEGFFISTGKIDNYLGYLLIPIKLCLDPQKKNSFYTKITFSP